MKFLTDSERFRYLKEQHLTTSFFPIYLQAAIFRRRRHQEELLPSCDCKAENLGLKVAIKKKIGQPRSSRISSLAFILIQMLQIHFPNRSWNVLQWNMDLQFPYFQYCLMQSHCWVCYRHLVPNCPVLHLAKGSIFTSTTISLDPSRHSQLYISNHFQTEQQLLEKKNGLILSVPIKVGSLHNKLPMEMRPPATACYSLICGRLEILLCESNP